jgi:Signal peptidase, peptidase S26
MVSDTHEYNYNGPSMNPTFKAGDRLLVVPYAERKISVGDVIVFRPEGNERTITHRVIAVDARGVVTRGDNNNQIDPWHLQSHEIMGCVTSASRGAATMKVAGGRKGLLYARLRWVIKHADRTISRPLHPIYHRLADTGILSRLLPAWARPRVVLFTKPSGQETQLLMGKQLIGRRRPGADQWQIRRPFRLFIDQSLLQE